MLNSLKRSLLQFQCLWNKFSPSILALLYSVFFLLYKCLFSFAALLNILITANSEGNCIWGFGAMCWKFISSSSYTLCQTTFCGAYVHWKCLWMFANIQYALSINILSQTLPPPTSFFFLYAFFCFQFIHQHTHTHTANQAWTCISDILFQTYNWN